MGTIGTSQIITLVASAFSAVMLLITIVMLRRETRVSRLAPFIAIGTTLLTTFLYLVITGADVNSTLAWGFIGFGFLIGVLQGQSTKIYFRGKAIFGKRSTAYVVLWGLAYLVSVALAQLGNGALHAFAILGMMFGVGTALASNLVLLLKQMSAKPAPAVVSTSVAPQDRSRPMDLPEDSTSIKISKPTEIPK